MTRGDHDLSDDPADEFVHADLVAATYATVGGTSSFQAWGEAILGAVERLTDDRGRRRVGRPLFETMKDTAMHLRRTITPFQGMLEAPSSVSEVYQKHGRALRELVIARDEVLTGVLDDLAARVIESLQGVTWKDLEKLGAVRQQSSEPTG